jgi:hypothetical protein
MKFFPALGAVSRHEPKGDQENSNFAIARPRDDFGWLAGFGQRCRHVGASSCLLALPGAGAAMCGIPGRSLWSSSRRMSIPSRGPAAIDGWFKHLVRPFAHRFTSATGSPARAMEISLQMKTTTSHRARLRGFFVRPISLFVSAQSSHAVETSSLHRRSPAHLVNSVELSDSQNLAGAQRGAQNRASAEAAVRKARPTSCQSAA